MRIPRISRPPRPDRVSTGRPAKRARPVIVAVAAASLSPAAHVAPPIEADRRLRHAKVSSEDGLDAAPRLRHALEDEDVRIMREGEDLPLQRVRILLHRKWWRARGDTGGRAATQEVAGLKRVGTHDGNEYERQSDERRRHHLPSQARQRRQRILRAQLDRASAACRLPARLFRRLLILMISFVHNKLTIIIKWFLLQAQCSL